MALICLGHLKYILKWFCILWLLLGFSILTFAAKVFMDEPVMLLQITTWMAIAVGVLYLIDFVITALHGGIFKGMFEDESDQ